MSSYLKVLGIVVLGIVILWILVSLIRLRVLSSRAGEIITDTTPFSQEGPGPRVLVLGDSLAYGTGTSSPEKSVPGLVSLAYSKDANVENRAQNGKRSKQLAEEVETIHHDYELILIIIGGNDVIRPNVSLRSTKQNLQKIYATASKHADQVIALSTGDLQYTSFFLPPLNYYFSARSETVRDFAQAAADQYDNVTYVDLVAYNQTQTFTPAMEAPDKLHLSDNGARYWLEAIKKSTNNFRFE